MFLDNFVKMELKKCISCNLGVQHGATIFMCPNCGEREIIRCKECKKLGVKYTCLSCGFGGPN